MLRGPRCQTLAHASVGWFLRWRGKSATTLQPSLYDTSYIGTSAWPTDCLDGLRHSASIDSQAA